jgi:hypothetical protein
MNSKIRLELKTVDSGLQFVATIGMSVYTSPIVIKEPYTQEKFDDALGLILVDINPDYIETMKEQAAELTKDLIKTEDETV